MNSEQTLTIESPNLSTDINAHLTRRNIKEKLQKAISYLKPTIINAVITFTAFIILIAITKKLGITIALSITTYLVISLLARPLLGDKIQKRMNGSLLKKNKIPLILSSDSSSVVLLSKDKLLIGISLLKAEWLENYLNLSPVWDLLQQEGIQIQDCREGCFFIIRKKVELKRSNNLQELAVKLVKEIEKCILLLKKLFDIEFENLNLYLVKGQDKILTIINLGLESSKFASNQDLTDEDLYFIRASSLDTQEISIEEK